MQYVHCSNCNYLISTLRTPRMQLFATVSSKYFHFFISQNFQNDCLYKRSEYEKYIVNWKTNSSFVFTRFSYYKLIAVDISISKSREKIKWLLIAWNSIYFTIFIEFAAEVFLSVDFLFIWLFHTKKETWIEWIEYQIKMEI